jgi:threonine/homoserine/homoserine lactone efflux protein
MRACRARRDVRGANAHRNPAMTLMPLATWLIFCAACVALALTPGPNMLLLVTRTLAQGRRAGILTLAGTQTGLSFHIAAVAFGLAALIAAVPLAYDAIRVAGALYLAFLAVQTWRERDAEVAGAAPLIPAARLYRDGMMSSVLNPKIALFELALLPQFVDPARGSVLAQTLILGVTQFVIVFPFDAGCVFAAAGVRRVFERHGRFARWSRRALAGVFAALALRLALDVRR